MLLNAAFSALDRGEYELALGHATAVLRDEPDSAPAWRVRAVAEWELAQDVLREVPDVQERRLNAVVAARRAVELAPNDIENLRIRARTLLRVSPSDALVALNKAARLDPADAEVRELAAAIRADQADPLPTAGDIAARRQAARQARAASRPPAARPHYEPQSSSGDGVGKFAIGALLFIGGLIFKFGLGAMLDTASDSGHTTTYKPYPAYTSKAYPTKPNSWQTTPAPR